jgi:hypothetical protein
MRHFARMKALLWAPLLFAACAFADEAADRIAIGHAIVSLNEPSQHRAAFTGDGLAYSEFERLRRANPMAFRIIGPGADSVSTDHPTVTISHEPWGEATINFPKSHPSIAFITPEVALAEGACIDEDDHATTQTRPLLFVMKKEGDDWKIASLRVLAR